MNKKVIFVHGYTATPDSDWYPGISAELDKLGTQYSIRILPGDESPHSKDWLAIIDKEVKGSNVPVVLVGHSLGTRAVLLYLDKFEIKVDGVLLVAPFDNNFKENRKRRDENYADFFDYALDITKIKKLADKFVVMHSRDDSAIEFSQGERIAAELDAEFVVYRDKDHFHLPEHYPFVLENLKKLLI